MDETCSMHEANTFETGVGKRPRLDDWIILKRIVTKYPTRVVQAVHVTGPSSAWGSRE